MKTLILSTFAAVLTSSHLCLADTASEPSAQEYRARRMQEKHATKVFAPLDYWGTDGLEWGTEPTAGPAARQVCGLACRRELRRGSGAEGLTQVNYHFASGITNRSERLRHYQQLKSELIKIYSAPTHRLQSDAIVRGQDAYVQAIDKEYRLEWHGPETIVSLTLSDQALALQFRQASTSRAKEHRENVKQARAKEKRLGEKLQSQPVAVVK